ncbi:MAG: YdcF family protein [Actinomycetota bacterium]
MKTRSLLGGIALAGIAVPTVSIAIALTRVHVCARRAVANADPPGSTIVVFGSQALDGAPSLALRARLDHALMLYRARPGRCLAMAGGVPASRDPMRGGSDEVAAMIAYARAGGVPDQDLIAVRPGQNTREQVASTRRAVVEAGFGPVIAVSSSYHLARVCAEARRRGFTVEPSASAYAPDANTSRGYLAHAFADALGLLWYALPTRLTRVVDTTAGSLRHTTVGVLAGRFTWRELRRTA